MGETKLRYVKGSRVLDPRNTGPIFTHRTINGSEPEEDPH